MRFFLGLSIIGYMIMKKSVYIEGDGCNRRLLEKAKIISYLKRNGYRFRSRPNKADYLILFTCAFIKDEEDDSSIRVHALQNYKGRLLVFGCLPDIAPHRIEKIDTIYKIAPKDLDRIDTFFEGIQVRYADILTPSTMKNPSYVDLVQLLKRNLFKRNILESLFRRLPEFFSKPNKLYYLMVCQGCLGNCSYCAIRRAVGSTKSKPIASVIAEFHAGIKAGYHNFVLLGDDLGSYGLDGPGTLPILMQSLQEVIKGINKPSVRFHLKEVHPKFLLHYEDLLLPLFEPSNIKSLLCPIQSGSPRILGLMRREHTVDDIKRLIGKIHQINPDIELATQIIVGFPTETEEDFEATLRLVAELKFRWLVVFPYDPKNGTPAAAMAGQIPIEIVRKRVRKATKYFRHFGIKALTRCPW